jgi:hypothetical protein
MLGYKRQVLFDEQQPFCPEKELVSLTEELTVANLRRWPHLYPAKNSMNY